MDQRTKVCPTDGLSVIVIDEDEHHANSTRSMLCKHNFHATAYTSPIKALDFLKDHAEEVDLILVAMYMEEMHGFQFLDIVREAHKNIQVISSGQETDDLNHQKEKTKPKRSYIRWTTSLHRKFLRALEILGEGACPRNIEILMNVDGVNRKHIASHLQKYQKKKEARKQNNGLDTMESRKITSRSKSVKSHQNDPTDSDIRQEERTADEDVPHALTDGFSDNNVYAAMRRALQLGTMFDESQYVDVSAGDEVTEDGVGTMGDVYAQDDGTITFGVSAQVSVAETLCADGTDEILDKSNSGYGEQDWNVDMAGGVEKIVACPDSRSGEIHEYVWL